MTKARPIDPRDQLDFEPTQPPAVADGVALAFGPQGVEEVCASVVDTDSMTFESSWRITEKDGSIQAMPAQHPAGGFPAAMATIVQLTQLPDDQIVSRKLEPCRWAFAWRIEEHRVAVAEAKFRTPRGEQTVADSALMRLICNTGIRAGRFELAEAVNDDSSRPWLEQRQAGAGNATGGHIDPSQPSSTSAAPALMAMRAGGVPFVQPVFGDRRGPGPHTAATVADARRRGGPRWTYRMLALAVLSVYLGMGALVGLSWRDTAAMQAEAQKLQARADATMLERVGETLARGDYGEVQHELDRLATLKHFNGAVVTNARGRTVAMAGEVRDVRMGDLLQPELAGSSNGRSLPLTAVGGAAQLLVWDLDRSQVPGPSAGSSLLIMGLGICAAATVAALFIARRIGRGDPQPSDLPPAD